MMDSRGDGYETSLTRLSGHYKCRDKAPQIIGENAWKIGRL